MVSEGFPFLIISLLRWLHEGVTDKETFISLAVVWVWMSRGEEGEMLLLSTLMQPRVSFEVTPDKQNLKPQSRWNFNLKFSIGLRISWNEMSGHCEICESLQVPKPQNGDWASLLKTRNVNHRAHKIFRTPREGQCKTSFQLCGELLCLSGETVRGSSGKFSKGKYWCSRTPRRNFRVISVLLNISH